MNGLLLGTSFIAGMLTILAPCVLPLLPVIIGTTAGSKNWWKPLIVTTSLALSIVVFTLLLKASSLLIGIPQMFWTSISGGIVLIFGIFLLWPELWERIALAIRFNQGAQGGLAKAGIGESVGSAILIGAALGPVFSSCSPTYFVILATVLPVNFGVGVVYLLVYALGIILTLGIVGYFGQRLISHLEWATNPTGWFKRSMGILLILVGLAVMTGFEKKIETAILDAGFGVSGFEEGLINKTLGEPQAKKFRNPGADGSQLPYLFDAPEFAGLTHWINSDSINSMNDLKGKVVLIDFWTYSCINCIRTLPYMQTWHERYHDDGLVIIGVHAPEFQFEKKFENVQRAVLDFGLTYPVVQDNDFSLWRAYNNHYWPAKYLIDQDGFVRYTHFGEGKYDETEDAIVSLLSTTVKNGIINAKSVDFAGIGSPETYVGTARRDNFVPNASVLGLNQWTLGGDWSEEAEKITSQSANAVIKMRFKASRANLVIGGKGEAQVLIDGKAKDDLYSGKDVKNGILTIDGERLYELTDFGDMYDEHEVEIIFLEPNISLFAWTFG
ncbi:MAG: cytochrome c biogenesis protein DipZ [bacterium]|nr:cytochrome c biogenesis protein DipZ [bacterium]